MKKKWISILLSAAICGSMLAGCAGTGEETGSASSAEKSGDQATADVSVETGTDGKVDGLMYAEGLPLVDPGTYSFSIFCDDSSSTGEFWMLDEFAKQTNVEVDLRYFPYETATERLNLDLNSGDYADVIGGWVLSDNMILTYGVEQGVFIPLEDYFEQYCPNISAILDLPGVREKMTAPDGHIYTIPYVCDDSIISYTPYINDEWLANVGMEMPSTTEELTAVLKAFKAQDANGNGDRTDEIPLSADPNNLHLESYAGYFGMPMNNKGLAVVDGETVYGGVSAQYREFLKWFSSLYKDGLVDSEIFTQDSATWAGKGNKDLYGMSGAWGSNEFSGIPQEVTKPKYSPLPVLNVESGGQWLRATMGNSVYRTQAVITDNAKNPEIICRWFDNAFSLENGIGCNRGPVGLVVFEEGGEYRAVDTEKELDEATREKVSWSNLWPQSLPKFLPPDFKFKEDNPLYDEKKAAEAVYEPNLTEVSVDSFWVAQDDVDRYTEVYNAVLDYYKQAQALFISGEQDVNDDAQWEKYVSEIKSLGLEDWARMMGDVPIAQ
ncbi:MAG: extracellular solute-binding protein [Clostridium sp.]|jgi:putative aldouronate transport system substrate-binding protein|nr:extracellular solute-binding protein [Clostridium sp.]